MLIVISPAKTIEMEVDYPYNATSKPQFIPEATELAELLKTFNPNELQSLLGISSKLAQMNWDRFQTWEPTFLPKNEQPALLAFRGDVYTSINADSFNEADFTEAQQKLRILSGLYGVLRPLDLIRPYRLEMGTKLTNNQGKDLYEFWGMKLTEQINKDLESSHSTHLINLASNEYFKALNKKMLQAEIITPVFKDLKYGEYKIVSFWAKKARGLMTRFILQNRIEDVEELKAFDSEGYYFNNNLSHGNELIFTRDH